VGPTAADAAPRRGAAGGFTLTELLIVVAIMVALLAIVVPSYNVLARQNRRSTCAANLKAIGQSLALFREDYGCYPPDATEFLVLPSDRDDLAGNPANLVQAAYDANGDRIDTGVRGLGLFTLYYLGVYSSILPPVSSEPRIGPNLKAQLDSQGKGLNGLLWFRGSGYIGRLRVFHCPANEAELNRNDLVVREQLPYLNGWNNYDMYYRRNFWEPGTKHLHPEQGQGERHLLQPYPPVDTVVTWCPYHRGGAPPRFPDQPGELHPGDQDLVLFADGSVRRMASQPDNRMYRAPAAGLGWPEGPLM
jgi:prepilin-type N-terminal cleavage/methylation domain-containing protein